MLSFEGDRNFAVSIDVVFAKLGDARFLCDCVPGVESVARADADQVLCTIRPGFSFARGTLELTLTIAERSAQSFLRIALKTKGIGSSSQVEATLTLTAADGGTHAHWTAEVQSLGGLLKAVPQGLIQASAQKVIGDALDIVETQLKTSPT
jgi:carbon monoxide dehydrogenase subunit G